MGSEGELNGLFPDDGGSWIEKRLQRGAVAALGEYSASYAQQQLLEKDQRDQAMSTSSLTAT